MAICDPTTPGLGLKLISSSPWQETAGIGVAVGTGIGVFVGTGVAVGGAAGGGATGRAVAVAVAGGRVGVGVAAAAIAVADTGTVAVSAGFVGTDVKDGVALGVVATPGVKVGRGVLVGVGVGEPDAPKPAKATRVTTNASAKIGRMIRRYRFMRCQLQVEFRFGVVTPPGLPSLGRIQSAGSPASPTSDRSDCALGSRNWLLDSMLSVPQLAREPGVAQVLGHMLNNVDDTPTRGFRTIPMRVFRGHISLGEAS
jgi:hypothetical protein